MAAVSNYRPISLLPLLSKVLERHVHSLLLKHLCETDPISSSQFGSLKGRSTTSALVSAVNQWHTYLDNGLDVCVIFFNLKKTFDSVPHVSLLNKLANLNLKPYLYQCMDWKLSMPEDSNSWCGLCNICNPTGHLRCATGFSLRVTFFFLIYIDGLSRIQLFDGTLILAVCRWHCDLLTYMQYCRLFVDTKRYWYRVCVD